MLDTTQDFLKSLTDINNSLRYSIHVPSLQEKVFFKQLSTKQFKNILETLNSQSSELDFNNTFVDILKENIQDKDIVDQLTVYDLYVIALYTRIICVSDTYTLYINSDEQNLYNLSSSEFKINLKDYIESKNKIPITQEIFTEGDIIVTCNIPLQKIETETNNFIKQQLKKDEKDLNTENILGVLFLNEITKCIQSIQINDKNIIFTNIHLNERREIVEQLPITLVNQIIKYIELYKNSFADLFLLEISTLNKDGQSINIQKALEYNATLFNY